MAVLWINPVTTCVTIQQWLMDFVVGVGHISLRGWIVTEYACHSDVKLTWLFDLGHGDSTTLNCKNKYQNFWFILSDSWDDLFWGNFTELCGFRLSRDFEDVSFLILTTKNRRENMTSIYICRLDSFPQHILCFFPGWTCTLLYSVCFMFFCVT